MQPTRTGILVTVFAAGLVASGASVAGQTRPWDVYEDIDALGNQISNSVCDVVNAANAELVVLSSTGQLVIVTSEDLTLVDTLVDLDGFVSFLGDPVGKIGFAEDNDGFRTLWWTSLTGRVVSVDEFTGEPTTTDLFPSDIANVPCDACPFWDDPRVCAVPVEEPVDGPDILDIPLTINFCGANMPLSMALTASGLGLIGLTRRGRARVQLRSARRDS